MEWKTMSDLAAIHATLQRAYDEVATLYRNVDGVSPDTAFAIGEALGVLSKAKALVGRDIDQAREPKEGAGDGS
jgi:hypothetical protein